MEPPFLHDDMLDAVRSYYLTFGIIYLVVA